MKNWLRVSVLIFVCVIATIALRQKFSSDEPGDDFIDQQPKVVAQEIEQLPEQATGITETGMPKEQERATYLVWSDDPEIVYKKYLLATYLYKKHESMAALPLAISYATQLGRFDEASLLLKELPDIHTLKDTLEIPVLMKLLMNTSDLSFSQLKQLKDFIETLKTQNSIDAAEYNFYFFVITLIKWDMDNAKFYVQGLQEGKYAEKYTKLISLEDATKQYGETPSYYLRGVWAMFLYQQWLRWPARNIGQQIRQEDPNYLLAEQLVAYSSMALQDWKAASLSLQQLQKIDPSYADVYQFFQAITHYSLREYEASILLFQQIPTTSTYYADVVRYMFLAYVALKDEQQIGAFIEQLVNQQVLQDADVYTLFDALLYNEQEKTGYELYTRFSAQIEKLEERCQKELNQKAYICLYGKGGILLATWEKNKAYQILRRIVTRYPRVSLYKTLWELATDQWLSKEAEDRYHRAFLLQQEDISLWREGNTLQLGLQ